MLGISTKGRYAVRIMVRLVCLAGKSPVRKTDIATAEGISADYVDQILMKLRSSSLVSSRRGSKGGYLLACPAEDLTVADVVTATEGEIALAPCLNGDCKSSPKCVTKAVWERANNAIKEVFADVRISDLAKQAMSAQEGPLVFDI